MEKNTAKKENVIKPTTEGVSNPDKEINEEPSTLQESDDTFPIIPMRKGDKITAVNLSDVGNIEQGIIVNFV
jgi:hypothetical protein